MIRHLAPLPVPHSLLELKAAARSRFPSLIDVNLVDVDGTPNLAVYLPDGNSTDPAAWQASVAAHVPSGNTPEQQAAAEVANRATIEQQIRDARTTIATIIGSQQVTFTTTAQAQTQMRQLQQQVKDLAAIVKQLGRQTLGDFQAVD